MRKTAAAAALGGTSSGVTLLVTAHGSPSAVTLILATVVAVIALTVIVIVCGVLCLARKAMKDADVPDRIKILKSVLDALVTLGRGPHQQHRR